MKKRMKIYAYLTATLLLVTTLILSNDFLQRYMAGNSHIPEQTLSRACRQMPEQQLADFVRKVNALPLGAGRNQVIVELGRPDNVRLLRPLMLDFSFGKINGFILEYYVKKCGGENVHDIRDNVVGFLFDKDQELDAVETGNVVVHPSKLRQVQVRSRAGF